MGRAGAWALARGSDHSVGNGGVPKACGVTRRGVLSRGPAERGDLPLPARSTHAEVIAGGLGVGHALGLGHRRRVRAEPGEVTGDTAAVGLARVSQTILVSSAA